MKKFYFLILLPLLLCAAAGCGKDKDRIDEPDEPDKPEVPAEVTLELSGADLVFEAEGGQKTFTITCNAEWTLTNESDWCTTDVTAGTGNRTVTVKAQTYDNALEDRNMNLTVKAGGKAKVLTVTQKHGNAIVPDKAKFEVAQGGGDLAIRVRSNVTYEVTIPDTCSSWIQPAPETRAEVSDTTYRFIIAENETDDSRTGYIIFSAASLSDTVRVFQAQKDRLVLTQTEYKLFGKDTTITVELKSNVDYEVSILGDAASWMSRVETRACRVDRLQFHIEKNTGDMPREGKIVFQDKNSDLADTLFVKQFAKDTYRGDIIFQTKQDLIDFRAAGNKKVIGNMYVRGDKITTLRELGDLLVEIDGDLTLECYVLESLEGLGGLKRITGNLIVTKGKMTTFDGLDDLESIGDDFKVISSSSLNSLESFSGLDNLESIGGSFKVISSDSSITYSASTYSLRSLKSFSGLNKLKSIGGDLELNSSSDKDSYYSSESYSLKSLESFSGLDNLESIGGSFKVISSSAAYGRQHTSSYSLNSLKSFSGLSKLKSIGGDFELNSSTGSSSSSSLNALESFSGLDNLESIGGNFKVISSSTGSSSSLGSLESFSGLSKLKSIGGDFELNSSSHSSSVSASPSSYSLNALKSFEGLDNLESIGGSFKVISSSSSSSPYRSGPSSSSSLHSLKSFSGLNKLKSIGGDFELNSNSNSKSGDTGYTGSYNSSSESFSLNSLESFSGLENLESIGGSFKVISSSTSSSYTLSYYDTSTTSSSLNSLKSFSGLSKLKSIGGDLELNSSSSSSSSGCYSGSFSLNFLESFEGLENLESIGGSFKVKSYSFSSLHSLKSFSGLGMLKSVLDISITGCRNLYDFCVLKEVVESSGCGFTTSGNGYNPTKNVLLNGNCSGK